MGSLQLLKIFFSTFLTMSKRIHPLAIRTYLIFIYNIIIHIYATFFDTIQIKCE